ncbi:DUF1573 domain-containing protein [Elusimicrobiota bacterium]
MKKILLLFFFILTIIIMQTADACAAPSIRLSESGWEIGNVDSGVILKKILRIKNAGDEDLLLKFRSSCSCIKTSIKSTKLEPEHELPLEIVYDTRGESGAKRDYVFIDSNDPQNPYLRWIVEASIEGGSLTTEQEKGLRDTVSASRLVKIYMFSAPGCRYCISLKEKIIPDIGRDHGIKITIEDFSLDKKENYEKLLLMEQAYKNTENEIPVLFIGKTVLGGKKNINSHLKKAVLAYTGLPDIDENERVKEDTVKNRINKVTVIPVLAAGLVDGINPCAFGAIVFLISYLSLILKRDKREVLATGISFSLGVFLAYFALGVGLSGIIYRIKGALFISRVIYLLIGALTAVLAVLSLRDYLIMKNRSADRSGGSSDTVLLKLPNSLLLKILDILQKHADLRLFVMFAFITGIIISLLELVCTGQIYLPTIMYMLGVSGFFRQAVIYLFLYCLMFITPLITVFFLFYMGTGSKKIEEFAKKNFSTVKLLNTIIFAVFAIYMLAVGLGKI